MVSETKTTMVPKLPDPEQIFVDRANIWESNPHLLFHNQVSPLIMIQFSFHLLLMWSMCLA